MGGQVDRFGFAAHYRSGALLSTWSALSGDDDFCLKLLRQQFSKATDPYGGGRQMVYHVADPDLGILPVQSPVGMQLGKAAGYAHGFKARGIHDAFVCAAIGDGSTAEGDMHDAMTAASVWKTPLCIMVTDNNIAISTKPEDGRGIKDFELYARSFGLEYFEADGTDFESCYEAAWRMAHYVRTNQRGALWLVRNMPRLNGHSSAGNYRFDLDQPDPILIFGQRLVLDGVLEQADIVTRIEGRGADYFNHHDLGRVMAEEDQKVAGWFKQVAGEPEPDAASIWEHIRPPIPTFEEPADLATRPQTAVTYAGALRAAYLHLLETGNAMTWGQDLARLGGVMQATAGLHERFPDRVVDAPLNEPLIVGTAMGASLHPGLTVLPEIQFGDYSLNAYHWLVYLGNLYWTSGGQCQSSVIVRMPTDPFGGGAVYHSMSVDGFFTPIPGLVIVMPSTSYDAYGLLVAAAEYGGPVVFLEPKWFYRRELGPAFPDEPTDAEGQKALRDHVRKGGVPAIGEGVRVPLGKGIVRRPGRDLTLVSWGRAAAYSLEAAEVLAEEGVDVEVIDLRTIVPPDMELVFESVDRTGRLVVAAEDRTFAGFAREIQAQVVERRPGVATRAVGMHNVPAIGQSPILEAAAALNPERIQATVRETMDMRGGHSHRLLSSRHSR